MGPLNAQATLAGVAPRPRHARQASCVVAPAQNAFRLQRPRRSGPGFVDATPDDEAADPSYQPHQDAAASEDSDAQEGLNGLLARLQQTSQRPLGGTGIAPQHMFGHDAREEEADLLSGVPRERDAQIALLLKEVEVYKLRTQVAEHRALALAATARPTQSLPGTALRTVLGKRRRSGSSSACSESEETNPYCAAVTKYIEELVGDSLTAVDDELLFPIIGDPDDTGKVRIGEILVASLSEKFPKIFADEDVTKDFVYKLPLTKEQKKEDPAATEGGVIQFMVKLRSQAGQLATKAIQGFCKSANIPYADTTHRSKNTKEEKQTYISMLKALDCLKFSWLEDDPLGNPHFKFALACVFAPHLLKKVNGEYVGFKDNADMEFGIGQAAFVRAKLRCRIEQPDLAAKNEMGVSHGTRMAAELMLLREELAAHPSTAVKVVDPGHDFMMTEKVQQYYEKKFKAQAQDEAEEEAAGGEEQGQVQGADEQ